MVRNDPFPCQAWLPPWSDMPYPVSGRIPLSRHMLLDRPCALVELPRACQVYFWYRINNFKMKCNPRSTLYTIEICIAPVFHLFEQLVSYGSYTVAYHVISCVGEFQTESMIDFETAEIKSSPEDEERRVSGFSNKNSMCGILRLVSRVQRVNNNIGAELIWWFELQVIQLCRSFRNIARCSFPRINH